MTNFPFTNIEQFNDVSVKNEYLMVKEEGGNTDALLEKHRMENRDNSRTPMQWNNEDYAGFSNVEPWFPVNPNYVSINVEQQEADDHSILQFYKDLIQLKKSDDTFTYGEFNLIDSENSSIFAYTRTLSNKTAVIVGNLTNQTASLKTDLKLNKGDLKLHNYDTEINTDNIKPYEAFVAMI